MLAHLSVLFVHSLVSLPLGNLRFPGCLPSRYCQSYNRYCAAPRCPNADIVFLVDVYICIVYFQSSPPPLTYTFLYFFILCTFSIALLFPFSLNYFGMKMGFCFNKRESHVSYTTESPCVQLDMTKMHASGFGAQSKEPDACQPQSWLG